MLEPRPEISTASRLRSAIVLGAPAAVLAGDGATALALLDPPDLEHGFAGALQGLADRIRLGPGNDHRHPDPAVEGPRHLLRNDRTAGLEHGEDRRQRPLAHIYDCMTAVR